MDKTLVLNAIKKHYGFQKDAELARHLGINVQNVYNWYKRNQYNSNLLIEKCPEINPEFIISGKGEVEKTKSKRTEDLPMIEGIPYYDINVTASITESFCDIPEMPSYKINIPYLNDCTAAFPVFGESMIPTYNPGDTVVVKEVKNKDAMLWGETYLIITDANCDNLRTIKRVYISEDRENFILRANNPDYAGDTIVPCKNVLKLFIVKGKISRTQL